MLRIRVMTQADVPLGMRLKREVGWNQTEADWHRFLTLGPESCFVSEWDGIAVGTAAAFIFDDVAWIAMVLVDQSARGKGIGSALMRYTLEWLDTHDIASVRLDATPLGKPIYEKLGFVSQFELARYEGVPQLGQAGGTAVRTASSESYESIQELDREVTGTDRSNLLQSLWKESPEQLKVIEQSGYLFARPGERAWQVGPCIAESAAGEGLLADAWVRMAGQPVFADIPLDNRPAVQSAEAVGLTQQRRFTRMCRGRLVNDDVSRLWLSSGPEKG